MIGKLYLLYTQKWDINSDHHRINVLLERPPEVDEGGIWRLSEKRVSISKGALKIWKKKKFSPQLYKDELKIHKHIVYGPCLINGVTK